jgi:diguanylate cyclase (GGDEF)-like protein
MPRRYSESSRPTIGMFVNQIEGRGIFPLWHGVSDLAEEFNVNLVLFTGKSIRSPFDDERQFNVVYDIASAGRIDGLVIASGLLASYVSLDDFMKFLEPFKSIPKVSISLPLKDIPSVFVENVSGMMQTVEHLILKHGYRRIAFLKGPDTNSEAQDRFQAYRDALAKHNISINNDLVVSGDFRHSAGADAVKTLIEDRKVKFEALVCANDDMAVGAFQELQKRVINVPKDVALTGFDDIDYIKYIAVPLTTVHQPIYEQGRKAAEMVLTMIDGNEDVPAKADLPTSLVVRQSCGCLSLSLPEIVERAGVIENKEGGKRLEEIIQEKRDGIIKEALETLASPDEGNKKHIILLDILLDSVIQDIKAGFKTGVFLDSLNSILSGDDVNENVLPLWQRVIFTISCSVLNSIKDPATLYAADVLFQSAQILIANISYKRQSFILHRAYGMFWSLRGVIQKIDSAFEIDQLMHIIETDVPGVGIPGCYIAFYQKNPDEKDIPTQYSRLMMAFDKNGPVPFDRENPIFPTRQILPEWLPVFKRRHTLIVQPLFNVDEHFGYIVFELGMKEDLLYESMRKQISSAIKGANLFHERQAAQKQLHAPESGAEQYREVSGLSIWDELTGLYNKKGLTILGEQDFRISKRFNGRFVVTFAVLPGLKKITEEHGKQESDEVLRNAAKILKESYRHADIIGRTGPDEFIVLATEMKEPEEDLKLIDSRLQKNLEKYNSRSHKPYQISIQLETAVRELKDIDTFEDLMRSARDK